MANKIHVEIITPTRTILKDDFSMVVVRALDGEIGILSDHMPLISSLLEWPVKLKKDDESECFVSVSGGFMEVRDNVITILATVAELPEEIDCKRAEAAKERAEARLTGKMTDEQFDHMRAEVSLRRAVGRLKTVELNSHTH